MIQRQRDLLRMGIFELRPGHFQRINRPPPNFDPMAPATTSVGVPPAAPVTAAPPPAAETYTVPAYIPPPLPAYAPGYMPSPVRPGFEGMPSVPDYASKSPQ